MKIYNELEAISKNSHYLNRYFKFLRYCKNQNKVGYTEKHHILPVSLFPKFKREKENIIELTGRQHFIAHWMLAKITRSPKMWFSFNQMRRIGNNSILYEYAKQEISKAISKSNSGRILSKSHIEAIKNSLIGKKPAKNVNTNLISWEYKNDPRWKTGEFISPRKGYKHSSETKNKIKNKNKGKKMYQNNEGVIRMFKPSEVPEDFFPYDNPAWHESNIKDTVWYYNPIDKKSMRILKNEKVPKGLIKGRASHTGFKNINNSNKVKYIDLYTLEYVFLEDHMVDCTRHVRYDGQSLDNIIVLLYNNKVAVGKKNILKYLKTQNIFLSYEELEIKKIKQPHHNNSSDVFLFRKKFKNKNILQLGINLYKLKDFKMKSNFTIVETK